MSRPTQISLKRKAGVEGRSEIPPSQKGSFRVKPVYALKATWFGAEIAKAHGVKTGVRPKDVGQGQSLIAGSNSPDLENFPA